MNDMTFKSYITEGQEGLETINLNDGLASKLLPGETLVTEAPSVMMFDTLSDQKRGVSGLLSVTTFKLSFVSSNKNRNDETDNCYQQSLLLGLNEICLSSIETIYQVGDRRKKLTPSTNVSGKIKGLAIICKNMRTFEFSFKFSEKDHGKNVANALLHHAFPKRHSLLFAYEFREGYYNTMKSDIRLFRRIPDWKREMERTGCKNWRISTSNQSFHMSESLPQALVVPASVTDTQLNRAVEHFRNRCCPVWVWSSKQGTDLVRMADLLPTITDRTQENILLENIRKCHMTKLQPIVMDLTKECPSVTALQQSYQRLRDLCVPDSLRTFKTQDWKLYGLLDASKWLTHVSTCLQVTNKICGHLRTNTVVLQEGNGTDMNCLVSSLIQLVMDPYWRTVNGFQSLVQKEWVALGHPFSLRLGHVWSEDGYTSPVFLLFLDCVWQLLRQFPTAFQFTETYLTSVWDSTHISVFETFLFNNEHDRFLAENDRNNPMTLRSVWDWKEQFSDKDIVFFCNPLYDDCYTSVLEPLLTAVPFLELWVQCYFRWLPSLEIPAGGQPQIDLYCRALSTDIYLLRQKLLDSSNGAAPTTVSLTTEENLKLRHKVNSFFPFSHNAGKISEIFAANNSILSDGGLDTQSILNNPDYRL